MITLTEREHPTLCTNNSLSTAFRQFGARLSKLLVAGPSPPPPLRDPGHVPTSATRATGDEMTLRHRVRTSTSIRDN